MKHFSHSNKTIFSKDWNGAIENNGIGKVLGETDKKCKTEYSNDPTTESEAEIDNYHSKIWKSC